ncbi:MAG: hypothetical protein GW906_08345 [Epsilonproteobacteria bacterium]|nr:hypothetical protein [Campylobacterota bacterium]OIO16573.1 MAG: hypothetical protein AUJ81_04130 [Helicobacteraceae bacterium CG1_02_36_14]PIP11084.1 MAG: hypothetical protein COX50_02650 [Sulfurimonas sp. CG23_combo_of_CG06-09_8_20_14_all_36_33]PIS24180.1 MAG: hypothetical protein COT46_10465 [Sulfurimonas sp. CG08_land_8_20_14_0_20_36_33]PIU33799.1 MAG: hypothetical protein COT05_10720 [Sulfurimonas sp. CG07_land_8_20_14_0_80_36_56]PIV04337.1 MAG: hypothetical protein COS56_05420 [Sulfur
MKKRVAFIPPSGIMVYQDSFFRRILKYFHKLDYVETYLISISNVDCVNTFIVDYNITVSNYDELITFLKKEAFDLVIHRTWMHRYKFAGNLSKDVNNIVFYIKDWIDEIAQDKYKFLFNTVNDYEGIKEIFENGNLILSHYATSYRNKLANTYNVSKEKFIFFPEYCNEENFVTKKLLHYKKSKNKKLLWIGGFVPTTGPQELGENKYHFETARTITGNNIKFHFFLLKKRYDEVFNPENKLIWQDWLYEHQFNKNLKIKLGTIDRFEIFEKYNFAVVAGLKYDKTALYQENYSEAVVSKLAFYMELGIPMIVNKRWSAIAKIVAENKLGIVISNKELKNLNTILNISKKEYKLMVENIYDFRKTYTYNDQTMKPILEMLK